MKKFPLPMQILTGLIAGITVGYIFHDNPAIQSYLKPLGDIFMRLIKMLVVPIVISSIVVGVAGLGNAKKLGRIGFRTILYFEIATTLALVLGILFANFFHPGSGINMQELTKGDITNIMASEKQIANSGHLDFIVNIVPSNVFDSIAKGELLPVIFFSVLLGLGVSAIGEKGQPILNFLKSFSGAMFYIVKFVLRVAPFGVFGLIGVTVSKFGIVSIIPLGKLIITCFAAYVLFFVVVFGIVSRIIRINFIEFIKLLKAELLLVFSTASSESVLPQLMEKLEKYGCPKSIVSFVVPIGYSFNTDGTCLYLSIASIFIAQLYGIDMSIGAQISIILIMMITSKGISGVAGGALVVLLATLGSTNLPLEGVAFIAGIDFLLNMGRATVNVFGNALAAVAITKWEKKFDHERNRDFMSLNSGISVPAE